MNLTVTPARAMAWLFSLLMCAQALVFAEALSPSEMRNARALFQEGRRDSARNQRALEALKPLVARHPDAPLLLAYLGSSESSRAQHVRWPWSKLRQVDDGLALLEKALRLLGPEHDTPQANGVPVQAEVRLVAAHTYIALPGMFNTRDKGRAMAQALLAEQPSAPWPDDFVASVHLAVARAALNDNDGALARVHVERARPLVRQPITALELQDVEELM